MMLLKDAVEIIMTLAADNILDEQSAAQDPEVLEPMRRDQEEALLLVQQYLTFKMEG